MKTQSLFPPPYLAGYVSDIVTIENCNIYREALLPLIARGQPSIVFQVTDQSLLTGIDKKRAILVLYGQNTRPIEFYTAGHVTMIAYFLYPHMLKALFGFDARELTDLSIDLSLTGPARTISLEAQLLDAATMEERLRLLDRYVWQLAAANDKRMTHPVISQAMEMIQKHKGALPLLAVQKELYLTERTLQRLFETHIGLTPKMFSRICQFNAALQQLSRNGFNGMAAIAYENGYSDQSHLIRSFREFTCYTPLEYLKQAEAFPQ